MLRPGVFTERKKNSLSPPQSSSHSFLHLHTVPSPLPYNIPDASPTHTLGEKSSGISDEF